MFTIAGGVFIVIFVVVLSVFCAAAKGPPSFPTLSDARGLPAEDAFMPEENISSSDSGDGDDSTHAMLALPPQRDVA